jgi:hypothetical protein
MPTRRKFRALSVAVCAIALAGCWHQETQQQKFVDAMNHGNIAQANQIWLKMDAKSRAGWEHSQGMQPNEEPDEVKKEIAQHYQDEMSGENNPEDAEKETPTVHLGGLSTLPEWVGPSGAPPQAVTLPSKDAPPPD